MSSNTKNRVALMRRDLVGQRSAPLSVLSETLQVAPATIRCDPDSYAYDSPPPPAEVIQRQIAAMAVIPVALRIPCLEHNAAVGAPCFGRAQQRGAAVCGMRVALRPREAS